MPHIEPVANTRTAPYVPFTTFLTGLDRLAPRPPDVIDRDLFSSFSGAVQSQLLVAFRFLQLIDNKNQSHPTLHLLVESPGERKDVLGILLREAYEDVFKMDLRRASAKQLDSAMEQYNVSGATLRKAVSFFVKAAQFSGLPLSPFITSRKGRSGRRKNGNRGRVAGVTDSPDTQDNDAQSGAALQKNSKTLKLGTGDAEVTLSVKFDPFTISTFDRSYIFKLVDRLSAYSQLLQEASAKPPAPTKPKDDDPFGGLGVSDDDVPF